MKKQILLSVCVLFGTFSLSAFANNVAVIDSRTAMLKTKAAEKSLSRLQANISPDRQRIRIIQSEISELQRQYVQSKKLSQSKKQALKTQAQQKLSEYNQLGARVQQQIEDEQSQLLSELTPKLKAGVAAVVKQRAIDVVVEKQNVYYVSPKWDITRDVTDYINTH